jgi:hypothetical protein
MPLPSTVLIAGLYAYVAITLCSYHCHSISFTGLTHCNPLLNTQFSFFILTSFYRKPAGQSHFQSDNRSYTSYNCHNFGHYPSSYLLFKSTTFRTLDSVSVFRWNLLIWAQKCDSYINILTSRIHWSWKLYFVYKLKLRGLNPWANYSDQRLSTKLVPTFADRECHVVSLTNPYGRILGFLDRSSYFFFQEAPQLYSRGWVDPVPDPPLLRKSVALPDL